MKITPDKWKHFWVGIAMGLVLQGIGWWLLPDSVFAVTLIVLIIVVVISYGFELFSKITGLGRYDIWDAIFSIIGGLIGMGLILIFQLN